MEPKLTPNEARIVGSLMEKARTTPDQYPMTLNALVNACNQKSSREPVMSLDPGEVQRTLNVLDGRGLVHTEPGNRVARYAQRLCNAPHGKLELSDAGFAVLSVLLLRGAQTPGELRSRTARLHAFADNGEVAATLNELIEMDPPLVARLPLRSGRRDHEYMHQFFRVLDSVALNEVQAGPSAARTHPVPNIIAAEPVGVADRVQAPTHVPELEQRVEALEQQVAELRSQLNELLE